MGCEYKDFLALGVMVLFVIGIVVVQKWKKKSDKNKKSETPINDSKKKVDEGSG